MQKPGDVFDRDHEWGALADFVSSARAGASLGLVYGRRRQGKTYLLQALAEAAGGFYFAALRQAGELNLRRLAEAYRQFTGAPVPPALGSWEQALELLLALGRGATRPLPVVIDEFPYLLPAAPHLPSALQDLLSPRGPAVADWRTRLVLCGSALPTMRGLLAGTAPLRGRAALELVVHSFDYRDAAQYWGVGHDPDLAVRLHALVGGTPAYLDMSGGAGPGTSADLDGWVARTLLNPASAMFREGNVLLSEEDAIADMSLYHSVLAAISQGCHRRGEIAGAIGRPQTAVAHPLAVLSQARLIEVRPDALRDKRAVFAVAEPVLRLHHLVIAPNETRLDRHRGAEVWASLADTVSSKIYGPHFETIARTWCLEWAAPATLGGMPSAVAATEAACRTHRCTHEIDVVVTEARVGRRDRVVALGEAKWRLRPTGLDQLARLDHLRDLLGLDPGAKLLLFSRSGFAAELRSAAAVRDDVELVDLERLYRGE